MARGGSNGGIGGSGVFGLFGSTVTCKSDDNSYYCWFVKFFNVLIIGWGFPLRHASINM